MFRFLYSIDGATMEIGKYAKVFGLIFKNIKLHFIGGEFHEISEILNLSGYKYYQLDELKSFDDWELYNDFFKRKL